MAPGLVVLARLLALLAVAALAAFAGCGGGEPRGVAPEPDAPRAAGSSAGAGALKAESAIGAARRREAARRAELRRLKRSPTVAAALRRALLSGRIDAATHDRWRRDDARARATLGRLAGGPRAELAAVIAEADRLAAAGRLTAGRFPAVFLLLRRNAEAWSRARPPAPGQRVSFGSDPAVFQAFAGRGLQLHPLASWGKVNGVAGACLRALEAGRGDCPERRLRAAVDRLLGLGARRDDFLAWEYYFAYGGGSPPWISGMSQGTAVQALARTARVLEAPRYLRAARRALGAFERPAPIGVAARAGGGRRYVMYSFDPGQRILNGELQAVSGLRDLASLDGGARAQRLFRVGERAARAVLPAFDTGAWSLYSERGRESSLHYHRVTGDFLGRLCRGGRTPFCEAGRRFARYEREPPRIGVGVPSGLRANRGATLRFSLSKISSVNVSVWGNRGLSLRQELSLPRGGHAVTWTPPGRGRYRLRVEARGPAGRRAVELRDLRVVLPKPKPRPTAKERRRAARKAARAGARKAARVATRRERRSERQQRSEERRERVARRERAAARRERATARRERATARRERAAARQRAERRRRARREQRIEEQRGEAVVESVPNVGG